MELGELLRNGSLGSTGDGDRVVSDDFGVLVGDVLSAGSGGEIGNLPESMMGSNVMKYVVNSIDIEGNAEVTFTVENPMTRESFTRIPGSGGAHFPWYEALNDANRESGTWADSKQTSVWTETIGMRG